MAKKAKAKAKPSSAKETKPRRLGKPDKTCNENGEANVHVSTRSSTKESLVVLNAFLAWDVNGDGCIDIDEMSSILTQLGVKCSESQHLRIFNAADCNHDGRVDYQEFIDWIWGDAPMAAREHLVGPEFTWHRVRKGRHVDVAGDGLKATRPAGFDQTRSMTQEETWGHAIVVGTGRSRKFQFRLVDNEAVCEGGFEAGFSQLPPEDLPDPLPATAAELKRVFLSNRNGELVINGEKDPKASGWEHVFVKSGTLVEVSIDDGKFMLLLDNRVVAEWQVDVPLEMDLYPLVSLFGTSRSIELIRPDAVAREPHFLDDGIEDLLGPPAPFLSDGPLSFELDN
eukprot:TRINITY_DN42799_c0_g1_i1.p1 TRINITY_DN42799_c0_g1~~TRINITY_DN42799_c0_g1_i1.p1  ORF type:complete len:340 (+),score=50.03 TRINITY_DN42799_c0_g1_i1:90-1109(+)